MRRRELLWLPALGLRAQQSDILVKLRGGEGAPAIALPDLRGAGEAQPLMNAFNEALYQQINSSGVLKVAAKSFYPLEVPQRPQDFKPPRVTAPVRKNLPPPAPIRQGPWLTDWSQPPVSANYLAIGYSVVQDGRLALFGWLYDVTQADIANAQVFGKIYFGELNEAGARKVAGEFAADILAKFGAKSLAGSKIYFISDRSGAKEVWQMDYDGANQEQVTRYATVCTTPAVSHDNAKIAFTVYVKNQPQIAVHSTESKRRLPFLNPQASVNITPEFTPDGKRMLFCSSFGGDPNIYIANADGSGMQRLTNSPAVDVEPKINPKTGREIVFISGRSGPPQLYRMNIDGTDVERLTSGEGDVANPCWHPDGQLVAFSWTRGFEPGNFNIFIMDIAKRELVQLTHGAGRNENPVWAPDGRHLVFASTRNRIPQIYTMLADGTGVKQLTFRGRNEKPVWSK